MTKLKPNCPMVLIVLDGWGCRDTTTDNAIAQARTPTWDHLWQHYPHTLLDASGLAVGLPDGQMGNSEVGHLTIGAGRVVYQDLTRINLSIADRSFFTNPALKSAIDQAATKHKAIHILGLVSPGGVHSHEQHIAALIELAAQQGAEKVYIHAFLDGRDTPPRSAEASLLALNAACEKYHCGKIVSIIGRYYAMDRDRRYERTQKAYDLITQEIADYHATSAIAGLNLAYQRGENDEFVQATAIYDDHSKPVTLQDGDTVIFMNFRADRARQLTRALVDSAFQGFKRHVWPKISMVTLTEYEAGLNVTIAYPLQPLNNILGGILSALHFRQLRLAETEKYAHVTFFFNGGVETPFSGEERVLIPSPKVATYDLQPEMSAIPLTERLVTEIQNQHYDFIVCNFANPDMVGHTGNLTATIQAIEVIDQCLAKIIAAIQAVGGEVLITADHGNAEMMFDPATNQPHTAHTNLLVPLVYVGRPATAQTATGSLSDVAPTILALLGVKQPPEMTGRALFEVT